VRRKERCCVQAVVYKGANVHGKFVEFPINCKLMQKAGLAVRFIVWSNSEEGQNSSARETWKYSSLQWREWCGKDKRQS